MSKKGGCDCMRKLDSLSRKDRVDALNTNAHSTDRSNPAHDQLTQELVRGFGGGGGDMPWAPHLNLRWMFGGGGGELMRGAMMAAFGRVDAFGGGGWWEGGGGGGGQGEGVARQGRGFGGRVRGAGGGWGGGWGAGGMGRAGVRRRGPNRQEMD